MAVNVTVTIDEADPTVVLNLYTDSFNYDQRKLPSETRLQFAKRMLARHIKEQCRVQLARNGVDAAQLTAIQQSDAFNIT
jgi:hypothetical protein